MSKNPFFLKYARLIFRKGDKFKIGGFKFQRTLNISTWQRELFYFACLCENSQKIRLGKNLGIRVSRFKYINFIFIAKEPI
jgi:hypothetical protein